LRSGMEWGMKSFRTGRKIRLQQVGYSKESVLIDLFPSIE